MSNKENGECSLRSVLIALIVAAITIAVFLWPAPAASVPVIEPVEVPRLIEEAEAAEVKQPPQELEKSVSATVRALVTGYNTVPEQTDSTPCIAASGDDICGRTDVVACPSAYPLGSRFVIDGETYVCLDRTAPKYDGRFDISCDKDVACPRLVHGYKEVQLISDY